MRGVLIDGSNVALHTAGSGKLKSLDCLAHVVHALVADRIVPYTVFDASFRYRMADNSPARKEFDRLTREVKQYFQMSPRGEKADLFLLELAVATGYPIISDDTFQDYGGVEDGLISYDGARLAVYNFQVIAGTVVVPDLRIRFRFGKDHEHLDAVADVIAALEAEAEAQASAAASSAADEPLGGVDPATVRAIAEVIEGYVDGEPRPLAGLGSRLGGHRQEFIASSGVGKNGRRTWFGLPSLSDFIRANYPECLIEDQMIRRARGQAGSRRPPPDRSE